MKNPNAFHHPIQAIFQSFVKINKPLVYYIFSNVISVLSFSTIVSFTKGYDVSKALYKRVCYVRMYKLKQFCVHVDKIIMFSRQKCVFKAI